MAQVSLKARTEAAALPTVAEMDTAGLASTAAKVRHLAAHFKAKEMKEDRGVIAEHLGIRYQWVRNILETPLKKA